jgi:2-polyprenyl-3-methyl-5-hydroxy-6-metoxy-1,4-benzoquinol methylase
MQAVSHAETTELRERKPCLLCGGTDALPVYEFPADYYDHRRWETASWDGRMSLPVSVVRCPKCDLVFSRPSFRTQALDHVYPADLVDPTTSFGHALAQTRSKHLKLLAEVQRFLKRGTLCDVGTRYGVLPHLAREAGFDAFGIEYNAASVKVACDADVPVFRGSVDDLPRVLAETGRGSVDAFVLDDVLEHLVDPRFALRTLSQCQQPGGLLFLQQMDLDSLGHKLFQRNWYYLQPAAHMFYFSERTLRALLGTVGYEIKRVVRPRLLTNLRRTLSRTMPGAASKLLRAAISQPKTKRKPSYLTCRLRSADDMFLVVAAKR